MKNTEVELLATATFGVEALVKDEIKELGYSLTEVKNGSIGFKGGLEAIPRANLNLRCAERVMLKIGEFYATNFDELYEQTRALPWAEWLPRNAKFPVLGKSVRSQLHSVPACQAIVKKAVVDSLKDKYRQEWFAEDGPLFAIHATLLKDRVTLALDTSGEGLHKRGYRQLITSAPLQETLAAALVKLSRWQGDRILIDPFVGSGTIPIEAAMLGKRIAPGMNRSFSAEMWPTIPEEAWKAAREEALDNIKTDFEPRLIMGTDLDEKVVGIARYHARKAGVEDLIHFQVQSFTQFQTSRKYGYIITNPPYGERISDKREVEALYGEMGHKFSLLDTWSFYILTSHPSFERYFGKKANKRRKLYNGGIQCQYYQYFGPRPPREKREG